MKLRINGQEKAISPIPNPPTLSSLIRQLGHQPGLVVVEFNGQILTPENWEQQELNDGDNLEIVTIVGGGS